MMINASIHLSAAEKREICEKLRELDEAVCNEESKNESWGNKPRTRNAYRRRQRYLKKLASHYRDRKVSGSNYAISGSNDLFTLSIE